MTMQIFMRMVEASPAIAGLFGVTLLTGVGVIVYDIREAYKAWKEIRETE